MDEKPDDYVEIVKNADGTKTILEPVKPVVLTGPLMTEWGEGLQNANADDDRSKLANHVVPFFQTMPLAEAQQVAAALAFLDHLKAKANLSPQSQRRCMNLVSRFFAWAVPRKLAEVNPIRLIPQGERPAPSEKSNAPWLEDPFEYAFLRQAPARGGRADVLAGEPVGAAPG